MYFVFNLSRYLFFLFDTNRCRIYIVLINVLLQIKITVEGKVEKN